MPTPNNEEKKKRKAWIKDPSILTGGKSAANLCKIGGREMCDADSVQSDSCDAGDELFGDVEYPPIALIEQILMRAVREYARRTKDGRRCMMCPSEVPARLIDYALMYDCTA